MSERMPAVLMVVPNYLPYLGGLERQAHTLGAALARAGCRVTVLTRRLSRDLPASELIDGVRVLRLPSAWRGVRSVDPLFPLALGVATAALAPRHDLVHLHAKSWFMLGSMPLARLLRRPVLVKLPNVRERGVPGMLRRPLGRQLVALLRQADAWAVLSPESRAELTAAGFAPERIFETRNGVDLRRYTPADPATRARLRAELGLPPDATVALFAGRLTAQKGLADLLGAWEQARASAAHPLLAICGDGPLRAELERLAASRGLADVRFVGKSERMADWYRAADLFALPSYAEGNSNALLEAMACGLPVVASLVGGTAELVGPQGRHLLHEPGDVAAIAAHLRALLADPEGRANLGRRLSERARAQFSIDVVARHYLACYRLLISGRADAVGELLKVAP